MPGDSRWLCDMVSLHCQDVDEPMWPTDPNEFEPQIHLPDDHDRADSWYFICINDQVACISEQGIPRPVNADEYRWLDIEIRSEHYMGQYRGQSCFAIEGGGRLPEGYALAGLREWLGRVFRTI